MSRIGNDRLERQETEDYRFGWQSAERGEPYPAWRIDTNSEHDRIENQRMGWSDFHNQESGEKE